MGAETRVVFAIRTAGWHFLLGAILLVILAAAIFHFWFPYPYRKLLGGQHLIGLIFLVDVVCGPLLTTIVARPGKSRRELRLDISLIVCLQILALGYGIYVASQARPVALVYEVDRFVAVSASQVEPEELADAPIGYQALPFFSGPLLVGVREPLNGNEALQSIELSMRGKEPSVRPGWWQAYAASQPQIQKRMRQMSLLINNEKMHPILNDVLSAIDRPVDRLYFLPLTSRSSMDEWIVILDENAEVVAYAPVGGFDIPH